MATVEIDETNGPVTGTLSHNIANSNYGNVDSSALIANSNPITPGSNSFQKWQQWHVVTMDATAVVQNLKYFDTVGPVVNTDHTFNGNTVQATYDGTRKTVYEQPDETTTDTPNSVPGSAPATANIGIGGSLTGTITADGNSSDFAVSQVTTTGAAIAGTTMTVRFQRDEIA